MTQAGRRRQRRRLIPVLIASTILGAATMWTPGVGHAQQQTAGRTVDFNIPAQPLGAAIGAFIRATGWEVGFSSPAIVGKRSSAVSGALPPAQALQAMLAGTNLRAQISGPSTVALVADAAGQDGAVAADGSVMLDTIRVQGESAWGPVNGIIATNSASGTRTDTPIIETPQTVNVVGGPQMQQQGVSTVGEALRYTPGVVTGTAGGQADRHDSYFVRGEGGFSAGGQYASMLDGMRWRFSDRTSVQFDPWMLERVEVVKGPASTLYGAGTPGGVVNLVSKRPSFERRSKVFVDVGTYDSVGTGFDFTGPLNDDVAYRIVGIGKQDGNGVDFQKGQRFMIAPSLTFAPTDATELTIYGLYQHDPKAVDAGFIPPYGSVLPIPGLGRVPASFWQGDPDWNEYDRTQSAVGLELKHDFSDSWKMMGRLRYGWLKSTTKALDFSQMVDPVTMERIIYLAEHDNESLTGDIYAQGKFDTGPAAHTVVFGVDHQQLTGGHKDGWDRRQYPTIDIFNPVRGITPNPFGTFRNFDQPFEQTGLYVQDQVAIGNWRFLGGLRYDKIDASSSTLVTLNGLSTSASSSDNAVTGRIGAVYLFDNGFAPFINYATSFNPQPAFKTDGSLLKPYTGDMLEAGLRYQSPDGSLFWSVAAFTGNKDGVGAQASCDFASAGPLDRCYTDDTKAGSEGVEVEALAQLTDGLDLIGALTWQNVRWKETEDLPFGRHVVAVPDFTAALWLNYTFTEGQVGHGWNVGGGVRHIGSTYATDSNVWGATEYEFAGLPSKVPSFTVFDATIGYDFGALDKKYEGLEARVSAFNLFDNHYVAACNGYGTCSYGKRREVSLKVSYAW